MILIFDIDGTLVDSEKRHGYLLEKLIIEKGLNTPCNFPDDYNSFKREGNNSKRYLCDVLHFDQQLADHICKQWINKIESKDLLKHDSLYPETRYVLETLSKKHIIYYLSSRSNKDNLILELKALDILKYANNVHVTSPKEGENGKIRVIESIKKKHLENIIIIGDTEIDYKSAICTDSNYYILNRGFRSKNYWDKIGIKSYVNLLEIEKYINTLVQK